MAGLVKLATGARLMLDGAEWTVEECRPQSGRLVLRGTSGQRRPVTIRALVNDPGFGPVRSPGPAGEEERAGPGLEDLTAGERAQLHLRVAHVLEAETGFRSGSPLRALGGEPRPEYDLGATTLGQRRAAKAAELLALGPDQLEQLIGTRVGERADAAPLGAGILAVGTRAARTGGRPAAGGTRRSPSRCGRRSTRSARRRCTGRRSAWRPGTG